MTRSPRRPRPRSGRLQAAHGEPQTGELLLGSVVFEPGPIRVTVGDADRRGRLGRDGRAGAVGELGHAAGLDPARRRARGPGQGRRPGHDHAARQPDDAGPDQLRELGRHRPARTGRRSRSTRSRPTRPRPAVSTRRRSTCRSRPPASATCSWSRSTRCSRSPSGGYAVEEVGAGGTHHLVAVTTGLFDDADGLVQVSGSGLAAGQRVVVPGQ